MDDLQTLRSDLLAKVADAADLDGLEATRVLALGRKGVITGHMKSMGDLPIEAKKERGAALNTIKEEVAAAITERQAALAASALDARLARERIDVSLPIRPEASGRIHPITQTIEEITAIFADMGFSVAEGPDIDDDFTNFTALNMPENHPARQMQDTFYMASSGGRAAGDMAGAGPSQTTNRVLRTHTSTVQVRTMLNNKPPIRIIAPGRTYRSDYDMTHTPMFHQVEGLVIDTEAHMGHLKGCLVEFCRTFFDIDDLPLRFRPSFFPFTEPSAEVDIGCDRSGGKLRLGDHGDWLEILGCGMVHPNVLENCGVDSTRYQGFAFGMGIERIAMLKYGIPDLRTFFEADLRWLRHYGFVPLATPSLAGGLNP